MEEPGCLSMPNQDTVSLPPASSTSKLKGQQHKELPTDFEETLSAVLSLVFNGKLHNGSAVAAKDLPLLTGSA